MHPFLMFIIALAIPTVIVVTVFLPAYVSLLVALYVQYGEQALQYKYDIFTTIKLYGQLYDYWAANSEKLDFISFTLPTLGIPALGVFISLYGTYRIVRHVRDIFILS